MMGHVPHIGGVENHAMTEIHLKAETPLIDRGHRDFLGSPAHVLRSEPPLSTLQSGECRIVENGRLEARRRRHWTSASRCPCITSTYRINAVGDVIINPKAAANRQ